MANNNKHTGPNVPALRFPEFSGEWKTFQLSDLAAYSKERVKMEILSSNNYVSTENMQQDFAGIKDAISLPSSGTAVEFQVGDILISNIRPYLKKIWLSDRNGGCSTDVLALRTKNEKVDSSFLYCCLANDDFVSYVMSGAKGVKMPRGDKQHILSYNLGVPSVQEQRRIAELVSLLEKRISAQSKIIEELTTLRSALYDSMFCSPEQEMPKFRIQSFSGKWQLRKLNEICSRKSIKNKDNLYSRVLTIAAQHGLVDQESFFKKRIASENLESYLCLEKGDFAYNKSYSSDYPWGAVKRLSNFDKGIISPLYICFTPKPEVVDPDYLAHYFESTKWHSGISEISGEGARNHGLLNMSVIDYFNTCHRIPGLDEQKAIARRLNAISHKLQTEQEYLELLNRQKDCFLKQMFI